MPPKRSSSRSPARKSSSPARNSSSPARNASTDGHAVQGSSAGARRRSDSRARASPSPPPAARPAVKEGSAERRTKSEVVEEGPDPYAVKGYDVLVHLKAISGDDLASIKAASDWTGAQVLKALEEQKPLLPGCEYKMILGDVEFTKGQEINDLYEKLGESDAKSPELTISTTVQKKASFQEDMDMALINAAKDLDIDRVNTLLSAGASAKYVHDPPGTWGSCDKKSALHVAIQGLPYGDPEPKIVESWKSVLAALLDANADVNAVRSSSDWRGCGSSSTAFEMVLPKAMQDAELLQTFLRAGADPNTMSTRDVHSMRTDGRTQHAVIHTATGSGNHQVIRTLLDAKANVNALATERMNNERGYDQNRSETSLHIACARDDVKAAALLLAHGADVNAKREELLHETKSEEEMIAEVPEMPCKSKKASKTKSSKKMVTDDPREFGYVSPVRCLPLKESALHMAIKKKNVAMTTLLIRAEADASAEYMRGDSRMSPQDLCGGDAALLNALAGLGPPPESKESEGEAAMMYRILKAFKEWDQNSDGFIGEDELSNVLGTLGMEEAEIPLVIASADWNRDGKVSYSEFVYWLYSGLAPAAVVDATIG